MMEGFDHILNWKLKLGSHPFPGQNGGTCINEAAIVAAGFPYQPIRTVEDMPDGFSRPICRLAMRLNDWATDEERQQLLPFVSRLACADTPDVERERAAYINSFSASYLPFPKGLRILEGALAIGRQADSLIAGEAKIRLDAVRASASTPESLPDSPLFAKIISWFGSTKQVKTPA